jgi:hypothetical protein
MRKFSIILESDKWDEVRNDIRDKIDKTIGNIGGDFNTFKDNILKNPDDFKIEGLINDSDIWEFYLKWRNEIDEILLDINFFDEVPSEMNVTGLYDYVITGTEKSIIEFIKEMN